MSMSTTKGIWCGPSARAGLRAQDRSFIDTLTTSGRLSSAGTTARSQDPPGNLVAGRGPGWEGRRMGAWRERNFRLLFIGQTVSALGNTLVPVALAFAVLDLTGSATDLGDVLSAEAAATVVFMLAGGVIADRVSRRALMAGADALRGGAQLALGLLLVAGRPPVLVLVVLSAVVGTAAALFMPASTGLLPALVRPEHLQQANALQQTSSAAAGVAGPAVAGVCVATIGPGWAIIADAGTFFVSVALLLMIQFRQVPRAESRNWLADLRAGWRDFWGRDWFRDVVIGASFFNLLFAGYVVAGPVVSKRYYGGAAAWAIAATALGLGSILGGVLSARLRSRRPLRFAVAVSGLACLAPLGFGALLPVPVIAAGAAAGGAGLIIFNSFWQTSVQRHVPEQMLSRASSYDSFGSFLTFPVGLALAGPIVAAAGPRPVLAGIGILTIAETAILLSVPSVRNLTSQPATPPAGTGAPAPP